MAVKTETISLKTFLWAWKSVAAPMPGIMGGTGVVEFEYSTPRYNMYVHVTQMWLQVKRLICSVRLVGMLCS